MTIEFEKDSAPSLEKFIQERDIKHVVFDIDNTLLDTDKYYYDSLSSVAKYIAENYLPGKPDPEEVFKDLQKIGYRRFKESGFKPTPYAPRVIGSVSEYLGEAVGEEITNSVRELLANFYTQSPKPYEETAKILNILNSIGVKLALHSHAQEDWTMMKVDMLEKLSELNFDSMFATDISKDKDEEAWLRVFNDSGYDIEKTLVVGDSLKSDIYPAINIGVRYLVWIDRFDYGLPEDMPEDIEVMVIRKLSEIENI